MNSRKELLENPPSLKRLSYCCRNLWDLVRLDRMQGRLQFGVISAVEAQCALQRESTHGKVLIELLALLLLRPLEPEGRHLFSDTES